MDQSGCELLSRELRDLWRTLREGPGDPWVKAARWSAMDRTLTLALRYPDFGKTKNAKSSPRTRAGAGARARDRAGARDEGGRGNGDGDGEGDGSDELTLAKSLLPPAYLAIYFPESNEHPPFR